jgi:hypothetical protein
MYSYSFNSLPPRSKAAIVIIGDRYYNDRNLWVHGFRILLRSTRPRRLPALGARVIARLAYIVKDDKNNEFYLEYRIELIHWVTLLESFDLLTNAIRNELSAKG